LYKRPPSARDSRLSAVKSALIFIK